MGREIFLDTVCLLALVRERDELHERTVSVMQAIELEALPLVTSDWVLAEFLSNAATVGVRARAAALARALLRTSGAVAVPASRAGFLAALHRYEARKDKEWSLVDCTSILICEKRGIRRVLTHDHHFRQAGFETLL